MMTQNEEPNAWKMILFLYNKFFTDNPEYGQVSSCGPEINNEDGSHSYEIEAKLPDGSYKKYHFKIEITEDSHDDYWLNYLKDVDGRRAVIDGTHYVVSPDDPRGFQDMAEREFIIEFFNGDVVTTHNLWYQGVVPPKHRGVYPDNAKFVKGKKIDMGTGSCWSNE